MPPSTQMVYFHLGMNADDDGIVEAFPIMRMIGGNEDDLKLLIAKNFVQILNEDQVTYIVDWQEHNQIRSDRKVDSKYKELLLMVNTDNQVTTKCQPNVNQMSAQVRLGKDSIGKDSIKRDKKDKWIQHNPPSLEECKTYAKDKDLNGLDINYFYKYFTEGDWIDANNNKVKNWKQKMISWNNFSSNKKDKEEKKTGMELLREQREAENGR